MDNIDSKPVMVYWCACGESIQCASNPDTQDRSTKIEFTQAKKWGRRVETITLAEFKTKPFMNCKCFNHAH